MKKTISSILMIGLFLGSTVLALDKDLEIQGKKLISQRPPFTLMLPSEFQLIHASSIENPKENSLTRVYLLIKEKNKQAEEMMIFQIADKTNPQAGPILTPPLKPYTEKRMYWKGKIKKGEWEGDYLIQLMAWNPEAPSLQPMIKKGISIPSHWAHPHLHLVDARLRVGVLDARAGGAGAVAELLLPV